MRYSSNPYDVWCQMHLDVLTNYVNAYYAFWWSFLPKANANVLDNR